MSRASNSYPHLVCASLTIKPQTTNFKWDNTKKDPQVIVYGALDTIKANTQGSHGILGNVKFTLGTSESSWTYDVINAGRVKVGLAASLANPVISWELAVRELQTLVFTLTTATFTISQYSGRVLLSSKKYNIAALSGQVCFWACSVPNFRIGLKVYENISLEMKMETNGSLYLGGQKVITQETTQAQATQIEQLQKAVEDLQIEVAQIQASLP